MRLAQLDDLLVDTKGDRWVVVITGGPEMGKSAILAEWLGRRKDARHAVPHHFIRQPSGLDNPIRAMGSLVARGPAERERPS